MQLGMAYWFTLMEAGTKQTRRDHISPSYWSTSAS